MSFFPMAQSLGHRPGRWNARPDSLACHHRNPKPELLELVGQANTPIYLPSNLASGRSGAPSGMLEALLLEPDHELTKP